MSINESPCTKCKSVTRCCGSNNCDRFKIWFTASWNIVVKPFRELLSKISKKEDQE
jgi:hypothetical protein